MIKEALNTVLSNYTHHLIDDHQLAKVSEPVTMYGFLNNKMLLIHAIQDGIPYSLFELIKSNTPFSLDFWADALNLSTKSFSRYQSDNQTFKPIYSEKIIELAEVTMIGEDVFGDTKRFNNWLETPNHALGNMKPLELLKNSYGKELVLNELVRIEHGIFS